MRLWRNDNAKGSFFLLARLTPAQLPRSAQADYWDLKAQIFQQQGRFRHALACSQKASDLYHHLQDKGGEARSLLQQADLLRQVEQFLQAKSAYARAQVLAKTHSSLSSMGAVYQDALCGWAMCERGLGNYDAAISLFNRCLRLYQREKDRLAQAYVHWAVGTTQRFAGRFLPAEASLKKSISLYENVNDRSGLAYARCGLGGVMRMRGYPQKSFTLYAAAARYFRQANDQFGEAYSLCGQSNALRMQHRLDDALTPMKQAAARYRRLKLGGPLGFVLWSRAQLEMERGRFKEAERCLTESQRYFKKTRDSRGRIYCQLGWGALWKERGHPSKAASLLKKTERQARSLKLPFEAAHAAALMGRPTKNAYKKCGVFSPGFNRYQFLP